jgi:putative N-acetylmannosamine-6-phosphate epimerase
MIALEKVVRLADEAANRCEDPAELKSALRDLGYLAFTSPTPHFQSDVIMSHVAHATYAAGLTALTGSAAQAQDAMDYTLEAARTAGAEDIERSLAEELARVRRTVAVPLSFAPSAAL